MRSKFILPLACLLFVVLVSGCLNTAVLTGNRPEDVVKSIAEVQEFLKEHPDADLYINYRSEGYIRGTIDEISERCGPYFKITDYWFVVFEDPITQNNITVWLEKDTNQLACLYGAGVDSPPVFIPGPEKAELTVTGFSGLDVSSATTEFFDKKLYLSIGNPTYERKLIKRVTASYLDDVIENITESGLISHGKYFTYVFNFSRAIEDENLFWIDVTVLYNNLDAGLTNQRSRGSIISGLDTNRIIQCGQASFEVKSYNFYVGTRILRVSLENTGSIDLTIKTYLRNETGLLEPIGEPLELGYRELKRTEVEGLTRLMESVVFVSESCPGATEVIFVEDIPGV
jgi:hypothetical protein